MVIQTPQRHLRVVLGGIQHLISHELAVLQGSPALDNAAVVDLHHRMLVLGVHIVVVQELGGHEALAFELAFEAGVLLLQQILVHQLRVEQIPAALDIRHTRLPVDIKQIDALNTNITQAIELAGIPHHLVAGGAAFEFLPHGVGIGVLELILFQYAGDDGRQVLGLRLIHVLSGQNVGLGISLHGVGVLADDDIMQPAGHAGKTAVLADVGDLLLLHSVAQLPPLLRCQDAGLGLCPASLVLLQFAHPYLDLFRANALHRGRHGIRLGLYRLFVHFHSVFLLSGFL